MAPCHVLVLIDSIPTIGLDFIKKREIIIKIVLDFKVVKSRDRMISMSVDAIYKVKIVKREGKNMIEEFYVQQ